MMYKIAWYKKNGAVLHYGCWSNNKEAIEAWIDKANKEYPSLRHLLNIK